MSAVWSDYETLGVDLGEEPPLVTADNRSGPPDRRRVSLRWLAGTVLAALASTSLMGGALYVALKDQQSVAMPVGELSQAAEDADPPSDMIEKGDMIVADAAEQSTRQIVHVSTISREGERDVIRPKPFARIKAPLITRSVDIVDDIPDYDPLRIFADANTDTTTGADDVLYGAAVEGPMMVQESDFPVDDASLVPVATMDIAATEQVVRETAQFMDGTNAQVAALPAVDTSRFDFSFGEKSAFEQYGVRIIPENVSFVATTDVDDGASNPAAVEEKTVAAEDGKALQDLLIENEATDEEAGEIAIRLRKAYSISKLEAGDRVRIALAPDPSMEEQRYRPIRVSIYRDGLHLGTVALSDKSGYVAADEPPVTSDDPFTAADSDDSPRPRLYESLYETALTNKMSPDLIDELVRIYSFDLDFNTRVQPGDGVEIVYSLDEDETETPEASEIVYTAITLGGKERRYYRFRAPDDSSVDYYGADGKSAKKFLLRKPMSGGTFRSGFGSRNHPILGYVKMHTGVDWSSPTGTPIMAAGDGIVSYAKWKNGYGNYIEIEHTNGYATAYAHQKAFAKGIHEGSHVRQGQIIGYVGTTGLSTGPHLHYEVHVNGTPVDPMRIKLPRGRTLDGEILAEFDKERDRFDELLGNGAQPKKLAAAADNADGG